jgi:hypothetical protein
VRLENNISAIEAADWSDKEQIPFIVHFVDSDEK